MSVGRSNRPSARGHQALALGSPGRLGLGSSPIRRRRPDCLAARADRATCRVDRVARYSEALVDDGSAVAESPTDDSRRSADALELAGTSRPLRMRAHPVKPRYWRAQERPRPPIRASRWPRRAGVSRGGHRWRARRAREPDSGAGGSNTGRRQQRSGSADADIRPPSSTIAARAMGRHVALPGAPTIGSSDHLVLGLCLRDSGTPVARPSGAPVRQDVHGGYCRRPRITRCVSAGAADGHEGRGNMGDCAHRDRGSQARCCSYSGACDPAVSPTASSSPGRGDGLASAAGFVGGRGTGGRPRLRSADRAGQGARERTARAGTGTRRRYRHAGGTANRPCRREPPGIGHEDSRHRGQRSVALGARVAPTPAQVGEAVTRPTR